MKVALALTIAIALIFKTALAQTEFSQMALETDKQIKKAGAAAPATPAPAANAVKPVTSIPAASTTPAAAPAPVAPTIPAAAPAAAPAAHAASTEPAKAASSDGFAEIKVKLLANLDKKIALINEHRVCIEASQNADEVKKCDEKLKAENQKLKDEAKLKQMQKLDENIKNLESKKKELEQKL